MNNRALKFGITLGISILFLCSSFNPIIGISNKDDTTTPVTTIYFDPPKPDGENGWFVSNVTIFLNASDDLSGVKEIRYTIDGGPELVFPGSFGSFVLSEEDDDILVEYWAIDNAGNVESPKNIFTIDIDKTPPTINLTVEVYGGNWWRGWDIAVSAKLRMIILVEFVEWNFYLIMNYRK